MLKLKTISDLKSINSLDLDREVVRYSDYLAQCRKFIFENQIRDYALKSAQEKRLIDTDLIKKFIEKNIVKVEFYFSSNTLDTNGLTQALVQDICYFDKLTPLLDDDSVLEVQVKDFKGGIFYETNDGRKHLYKDEKGIPVSLGSAEILDAVIDKLIANSPDAPTLSEDKGLVNARTYQGYRVSATHSSVLAVGLPPYDYRSANVSIRKQRRNKIKLQEMIDKGTLSPEMGDAIVKSAQCGLKILVVGSTGSGKTTLLDVVANAVADVHMTDNIILIQNPTEIDIRKRDIHGNLINNVAHWEAREFMGKFAEDTAKPTLVNLAGHSLRNTPDILIIGEMRFAKEFVAYLNAIKTGHTAFSSMHADDAIEALERIQEEIGAVQAGVDKARLMRSISGSIDLIVTVRKYEDKRRVAGIHEVIKGEVPNISTLYQFMPTGKKRVDEDGFVTEIEGMFSKVGVLSDEKRVLLKHKGISDVDLGGLV